MRLNRQLAILPSFLFIITCALGQDVHYNYAHGTNFSVYKTYQWIEIPSSAPNVDGPAAPTKTNLPGPQPNLPATSPNIPGGAPNFPGAASDVRSTGSEDQLIDQDIRRAVDERLAQKGLTKVEMNADIQVVYHTAIHPEKKLSGSIWRRKGSGWWGVDDSVQGETSTISICTLVVDLYDPARKQLIWRGDATKTIDVIRDPDKDYRNLQKAMAKLFKNYPPRPIK